MIRFIRNHYQINTLVCIIRLINSNLLFYLEREGFSWSCDIVYRNMLEHTKAPRIVLAVAGGVDHDQLVRLSEEHFGKLKADYQGEVADLSSYR
jgi:hypothetical protein